MVRALYAIRNGRVAHASVVRTDDYDEQKRIARALIGEFDCVEIWDGPVLCLRLRRAGAPAAILDFAPAPGSPGSMLPAKGPLISAA
jgi:hypothetical protein